MTTSFDSFWSYYPNRKGKGAARTSFEKQEKIYGDDKEFLEIVLSAIAVQTRFRKQQQGIGQFVAPWKNPVTWLNQECWTDEVQLQEKTKITVGAQCVKCKNPVMGPRFKFCEEHESWQMSKTMVVEMTAMYNKLKLTCTTVEEWRVKYRELAKLGLGGNHEKT